MADLIERQAAIDAILNNVEPFAIVEPGTTCVIGAGVKDGDVIRELENLPSAQTEHSCESCRYNNLEWDEEPCDSCTAVGETNHWKPAEDVTVKCIATIQFDEEKLKEIVDSAIVRCKDCKFWNPNYRCCEGIGNWFGIEGEWDETGFCYKGERREDGNE